MKQFLKNGRSSFALILIIIICITSIKITPVYAANTRVDTILKSMTLRQKITQMFMVDFRKWDDNLNDSKPAIDFVEMNDQVAEIVESYDFGALILFANNIKETEQSYHLAMKMQEAATKDGGIPLIICADQEGGKVFRLGSGTALPGNMALGAAGNAEYAKDAGRIIGSELGALGINTNLAPVVDVNNNANNPVIGLRSYGDNAEEVGRLAAAAISGMEEYGVISCAKHFPGHGDTETDSHYGLPIVDKSKSELLKTELKPYEMVIDEGVDMIMTAHILYPQLDSSTIVSNKTGKPESLPATMSKKIITDLLKEEMGFKGVVVTDSINMNAISSKWDSIQTIINAVNAGVDMICMPCNLHSMNALKEMDKIIDGIEKAVKDGVIEIERIDDAVTRILKVKENRGILDYNAKDYSLEAAQKIVGSDENRQLEKEIAAAAVTVVKNNDNLLPLHVEADSKVLMLCPNDNERAQLVMGWNRAKEGGLIPEGAQLKFATYKSEKISDSLKSMLNWADFTFVISEVDSTTKMAYASWESAGPENLVNYVKSKGKKSIVISAEKPYDVQLYSNADAIMAVYGCKGSSADPTESLIGGATGTTLAYGPNIIAGIEVAFGVFGAKGKLPVNVPRFDEDLMKFTREIIYPSGFGLTYEKIENEDTIIPSEPSTIVLSQQEFIYDGKEKKPLVSVLDSDGNLIDDSKWNVSYDCNVNVGTAKVTITFNDEFQQKKLETSFSIKPASIEKYAVDGLTKNFYYTGAFIEPSVTVKGLSQSDYNVSYKDNLYPGKAKVIIQGKGNYTGEIVCDFEINKAIIRSKSVQLSEDTYTYNGKTKKPTVKINGLKLNEDYTVRYTNNLNVGNAKVIITGMGNYKGTVEKSFIIRPINITSMKLSTINYVYDGVYKKPAVTVKAGDRVIVSDSKKNNSKVKITYSEGRKKPGTYKVVAKGIGNYSGTIEKYFYIRVKPTSVYSLKSGKRQFTVKWYNRLSKHVSGYQIRYSTSSSMENCKYTRISSPSTNKKTIKSLKSKKKYYVQVRTYKTISKKRYYSTWSKVKTVTIK